MFIAIYFLFLYFILYSKNKKDLFYSPESKKKYSISVLVPAFNEEKTIANTIEEIFSVEYPVKELIVINDGSADNTKSIVENFFAKYP